MDAFLAALGLKQGSLLSGLFGALVSYRFFRELAWIDRIITVICGVPVALYCGPLISEAIEIQSERAEYGITFLTGVIGISFIAAIIKALPDLITAAKDYLVSKFK